MNREKLNSLLDSIYELEGLVHLALNRDDSPEALPDLIARKGKEIGRLALMMGNMEEPVEIPEPEPVEIPEPVASETVVADVVEEEPDVVAETAPAGEPRGRLVFSINDRYRFKRELFPNSDADFNNTLALVASMENYDEAEDYFLSELQWDQKKPEVIDFLEILKKYFGE